MKLGKKELKTNLVLASGILGTNAEIMHRCIKHKAGVVTLKSIGPKERLGHNNPTVLDYGPGLINAVGLPTPGYLNMDDEWLDIKKMIKEPVIASIYGNSVNDFTKIIDYIEQFKPDIIELNVSCPNKDAGMMFGQSPELVTELIKACKQTTEIPIMPKLTPNCLNIKKIAKACEKAGADYICAINTVGPGMLIDIDTQKPLLNYKTGGISGKAIKPIAIKCVYDIYETVNIPILGMGGISSGKDAIEMMMAGATYVGIGSAVYNDGIEVFSKIHKEMNQWLKKNNLKLEEVIGLAHVT